MRSKLADLFYQHAAAAPDKPAICCDGQALSYREMAGLVSRYSQLLLAGGVQYGDHIAIPMNNSIESAALFFSAAELGACLVPLNPTLPPQAVHTAMRCGDVKHLIARRAFYRECEAYGDLPVPGCRICLDGDYPGTIPFALQQTMPDVRPACHDITGEESLILTMTSGSTGEPKPIDLSQRNKFDRAMAHVRVYHITSADRILTATPLYHSLAERLVILPLIIGATSILLPRFTPALWLRCVAEQQVTFTIAVSAQLAQLPALLKAPDAPRIDSLRAVVSSSALLAEDVKRELIAHLQCEFHEMYGTSEVSTATTICFQQAPGKASSVGLPFDGAMLRILREDGTACQPHEVGEIAVSSPLRCKGYYHQEAAMAAATCEGCFRTGDLGYLDQDGYLYFAGRKKELIITGAVNVYPRDIDEAVARLPGVAECAAFAYPDQRLGEVVALAVVPRQDVVLSLREIRRHCAHHLADFQQPHRIFLIDRLPKNAMGKLQRTKLLSELQNNGREL